ncbi:MAG: hypothetical protein H6807_12510 [Planctomycetes bacterium]|nr:hypothetical protein [Planctomycetota bacterium]
MKRSGPLLAAGALVLLLALVVLWRFLGAEAGGGLDGPAGDEAAVIAPESGSRNGARPARVSESIVSLADEEQIGGELVVLGPVEEADPHGIRVRVVEVATGAPLPGVDVFVDRGELDYRLLFGLQLSIAELMRDHARRFRSDAKGEVWLPRPDEQGIATVIDARRFGQVELWHHSRDLLLLVHELKSLAARVVEADGRPAAGIPVAWSRGEGAGRRVVLREFSGPDGRVSLPLATLDPADTEPHELAIEGLFAERVARTFDPALPPIEPIELVLPPHGRVEVLVRGRDGGALAYGPHRVSLGAGGGPEDRVCLLPRDGRACLEVVGLDLGLDAWMDSQLLADFEPLRLEFAGPTRAGETVTVELRPPEALDRCVLTGRAVAVGGPLIGARLDLEFQGNDGEGNDIGWTAQGRCDDSGRFRIGLRPARPEARLDRLVVVARRDDEAPARGQVELPELAVGLHDLGDVVLRPEGFLLSGRVIDRQGEAIPAIGLRIKGHAPAGGAADPAGVIDCFTDRAGAFSCYGSITAAELDLGLNSHDYFLEEDRVPNGARGLDLVASRLGSLRLRCVAPDGQPVLGLLVEIERGSRLIYVAVTDQNGRLQVGLRPGPFTITIRQGRSTARALLRREGLVLPEGGELDLGDLVVEGLSNSLRVLLLDPAGEPLLNGHVDYRLLAPADGRLVATGRAALSRGYFEVLHDSLPLDIDLEVEERGWARGRLEEGENGLRLQAGPVVILDFGSLDWLPEEVGVWSGLAPEGDGEQRIRGAPGRRGSGKVGLRLARPGRYRVDLQIGLDGRRTHVARWLTTVATSPRIEVTDSTAEQVFGIPLDRTAVTRLIAELQAR